MVARCAVCGAENNVTKADEREPQGPPDFDTRPGEPLRGSLRTWVQQCSSCGYAADDIASANEDTAETVNSPQYREILNSVSVPEEAKPFLCYSLILERSHQPADAGWSALHAAWVCDDAAERFPGSVHAATLCRERAVDMWKRGKENGHAFSDDLASEFALVTDLYRRLGEFEHATVACAEGLDMEDVAPLLQQLFRRQKVLIEQRDMSCHSLRELLQSGSAATRNS
jgi:hypothetical protein